MGFKLNMMLWQDKDKRRAFLLSLVVHALVLLAITLLWTRPQAVPLESFLVIDIGTPALDESQTNAADADTPAVQAPEPLVAAPEAGQPSNIPVPTPSVEVREQVDQREQSSAQAQVSEQVVAEETPPAQEAAALASPPPPAPRTPPVSVELPSAEIAATTLPEIDEAQLEPEPLQQVSIPKPNPSLDIAPARQIAPTPSVELATEQVIPQPEPSTSVATAQAIPQPQVSVEAAETQAIPQPQVSAEAIGAQAIPQPQISANVTESQVVPQPQATASVAVAQNVQPQVEASVIGAEAIPQPGVEASVASTRSVTVTPQVELAEIQAVPQPQVSANVKPSEPQEATPSVGQFTDSPTGGNADRAGQASTEEDASPEGLGLATSPEGSPEPSGAPFARVPYSENRERPLAVMIDNVEGYPQAGLLEASMIVEMPVEGGLTRLMTVYDRTDPTRVGPIRSARDYFHELATNLDGILVHDGGSPAALAAIERSSLPSINAYTSGELFQRSDGRSAPYNLYTQGRSLREAVARLRLNQSSAVSGTTYRPEATADLAQGLSVQYSADYQTAFRFVEDLNLYRWVRNGEDAVDALGEAVYVDAVLVASINARPISDDPEGRLYISLQGGKADLFLRGQRVSGRWDPKNGIQFVTSLGDLVDLTPFKLWVVFATQEAQAQ